MIGLDNERILGIRKQEITLTRGLRYTMATMARKKVGASPSAADYYYYIIIINQVYYPYRALKL